MNEPQLSAEMEKRFKSWYSECGLDPEFDEVAMQHQQNGLHFLATALEEQYKKALSDMFLAIAKLAEPDERQLSAGDLTTNMDNIWEIKVKLEKAILNGKGAE
jgi:hypothetical protein